ncbi:MAG: hypothetical protein ACT4P6_09825 [Gemmatimonadaceae bacterium]
MLNPSSRLSPNAGAQSQSASWRSSSFGQCVRPLCTLTRAALPVAHSPPNVGYRITVFRRHSVEAHAITYVAVAGAYRRGVADVIEESGESNQQLIVRPGIIVRPRNPRPRIEVGAIDALFGSLEPPLAAMMPNLAEARRLSRIMESIGAKRPPTATAPWELQFAWAGAALFVASAPVERDGGLPIALAIATGSHASSEIAITEGHVTKHMVEEATHALARWASFRSGLMLAR